MQSKRVKRPMPYASSEISVQSLNIAAAHIRLQAALGIGAGLLADVLLLVGALAWSKLTAKA